MGIDLKAIGTFETGIFDESAAEIVAHDPQTQRLFVTNGDQERIDIIDISDPTNPVLDAALPTLALPAGRSPTSVAVANGVVAVALPADPETDPGEVLLFDSTTGALLNTIPVGALPDSLTFTPDGTKILVANEGEADGGVDPEGSVSIIDISAGAGSATVATADFSAFDGREEELRNDGVRIFPGKTVSQDVEPEFIAVAPDGQSAFVTLQEANAVGVIDLTTNSIVDIVPLGVKSFDIPGNGIDPSDRDGEINVGNVPVFGMFMPDAIASYEAGGSTYYVTANEGDARNEDARVEDITLDPTVFPNAAELQQAENLGRLEISTIDGDTDGDGDFDQLFAYGSRSFTIWDASGNIVFDSGADFERITASILPNFFNSTNDETEFDSRSDAKGPEPEAVAIGEIDGHTYAFVGLERVGGIMVYDITDPLDVTFVDYINNRNFEADPESSEAGDLGPEGLAFIPASESPNGEPLLAVANEVSGTTTLFEIELDATLPILGTEGDDVRRGSSDDDMILGFEGDDRLIGRSGDDFLGGSVGDDTLIGGRGDDELQGGPGDDLLRGGAGDDLLDGGTGDDKMLGGRGDDIMLGRAGDDRMFGGLGDDTIVGGAGNDVMWGNWGDDIFKFANGSEQDKIYGFQRGCDTIDLTDYEGIASFDDLTINRGFFSTTVGLLDGDEIKLVGVWRLSEDDFEFGAPA